MIDLQPPAPPPPSPQRQTKHHQKSWEKQKLPPPPPPSPQRTTPHENHSQPDIPREWPQAANPTRGMIPARLDPFKIFN